MARHLLVTNDFPPKVGGIQNYLYELWKRLPSDEVCVLTTPYKGAAEWDKKQSFEIIRCSQPVLVPGLGITKTIKQCIKNTGVDRVIYDPALPLGAVAQKVGVPYGIVLHGAEVAIPARLPLSAQLLKNVAQGASLIISSGNYPASELCRLIGESSTIAYVPPGVDTTRFIPQDEQHKRINRSGFGIEIDGPIVLSISRLVPRKGMDTLIKAFSYLKPKFPKAQLVIAGKGRDRKRLDRLAEQLNINVKFLGSIDHDRLADLYGCADIFSFMCRTRWGGLEQEGFGIVLLEAAASGLAAVAGKSGGSAEAIEDGSNGLIVDRPQDPKAAADALEVLLKDPQLALHYGQVGRKLMEQNFDYDQLASALHGHIQRWHDAA